MIDVGANFWGHRITLYLAMFIFFGLACQGEGGGAPEISILGAKKQQNVEGCSWV